MLLWVHPKILDTTLKVSDARIRPTPRQEIRLHKEGVGREMWEVKIMPLIQLVEVLIVVGVLLWMVNRFIPMQGSIKSILNGVVVIAVVLWVLNVFGLFRSLSHIHVGT